MKRNTLRSAKRFRMERILLTDWLRIAYTKRQWAFMFEQKAFKVKNIEYDENGKKISEKEELQTAEERHYIEPDIKAIIFWLKNRKPEIWKEKIEENSVG